MESRHTVKELLAQIFYQEVYSAFLCSAPMRFGTVIYKSRHFHMRLVARLTASHSVA